MYTSETTFLVAFIDICGCMGDEKYMAPVKLFVVFDIVFGSAFAVEFYKNNFI